MLLLPVLPVLCSQQYSFTFRFHYIAKAFGLSRKTDRALFYPVPGFISISECEPYLPVPLFPLLTFMKVVVIENTDAVRFLTVL